MSQRGKSELVRGDPVRRLQQYWDGDERHPGQCERRPGEQRERLQGALLRQYNLHLESDHIC